jgi:hypothetical protein
MKLTGISRLTVAQKANRSMGILSQFLLGNKNSEAIRGALTSLLGYESFEKLLEAAQKDLACIKYGGAQ